MSTPTWTQSDIDTLKGAVASGVLSVNYAGPPSRSVTYQSLDSMRSLLAEMRADVSAAAGRPRVTYAKTSKGFGQ
ncbi:phage head-tail joining protein [Corallococcus soli]|uniref:phage head-tail joining protein n=1 Tax=Corallococcus soli TaxID=2710757 RepID=UPI0034E2FC53